MTHKQAVLRLLSDHQPHSHHDLYALGCVAHSRVSDLRKDGHLIRQWRDGDLYFYRLEAAVPSSPAASTAAPSPNPAPTFTSSVSPDAGSRDEAGLLTLFEVAA